MSQPTAIEIEEVLLSVLSTTTHPLPAGVLNLYVPPFLENRWLKTADAVAGLALLKMQGDATSIADRKQGHLYSITPKGRARAGLA